MKNLSDTQLLNEIRIIITGFTPLKEENINFDSHIRDELQMDSADMLELVMTAEEKFEINIGDEVFDEVSTIQDVINLVKNSFENKEEVQA